jgi:hypothetical protein
MLINNNKNLVIFALVVFGLVMVSLFGCQTTTATTTSTSSSSTTTSIVPVHALVGTWVGTWEDSYHITGSLQATITQSGSTLNGNGSIDLSGLNSQEGFSFSTEVGTAVGTISGSSVIFVFNSSPVGFGSGSIIGNTVSGSGDVTAFLDGDFIFTGTIEAGGTRVNAVFDFTAPGAGDGIARLNKQ